MHFNGRAVFVFLVDWLIHASCISPGLSLFPVIAEEDIETVEEGVFDVHL